MYVEMKNIFKQYGNFRASDNVNFGIEKGKLVALLGPSGSGKTTILRMIAGLETPSFGDIYIDGKRVNDVPANQREIGFVFQNYALFRHMTVYDNIAFGLKLKKVPKDEIKKRVTELLDITGLAGLEKRYPNQLSGGQRCFVCFFYDFICELIYGGAKVISDYSINEQIRDKEVRLIGEDGEQIGIVSVKEAMQMAREADLDLVKISPNAKPPVCKIIDYGKFRYEQMRKDKEAKKKQKVMETKEVRLSPNIDVNDLNTKANQARKFLGKGDKVKVSLRFRGREMAHVNVGKEILDSFYEKLSDIAVVDKPAKLEGRSMVMFLAEKK